MIILIYLCKIFADITVRENAFSIFSRERSEPTRLIYLTFVEPRSGSTLYYFNNILFLQYNHYEYRQINFYIYYNNEYKN